MQGAPKPCIVGKSSLKITLDLYCLIPPKWVSFNDPCPILPKKPDFGWTAHQPCRPFPLGAPDTFGVAPLLRQRLMTDFHQHTQNHLDKKDHRTRTNKKSHNPIREGLYQPYEYLVHSHWFFAANVVVICYHITPFFNKNMSLYW